MKKINVDFEVKEFYDLRTGMFHAYLYYKRCMETASSPTYAEMYRKEMEAAKALHDKLMDVQVWD